MHEQTNRVSLCFQQTAQLAYSAAGLRSETKLCSHWCVHPI